MLYTADEWQQYYQLKDKQMKKDKIIEQKLDYLIGPAVIISNKKKRTTNLRISQSINQSNMVFTADEWNRYYQSTNVQKKIAILEHKFGFPGRLRTAIDEAKEENLSPYRFRLNIEKKLVDWLSENWWVDHIDESKGLNCDRDTKAEVELAIRFFPNALSKQRNRRRCYPIYWQLGNRNGKCNLKAVSFIPLFAKLGMELGKFTEEERGGLICGGCNVLVRLAVCNSHIGDDEEHQQLVEKTSLAAMQELGENKLFKIEDIREYNMIGELCVQYVFSEQRFRYMANWDPGSLILPSERGRLPIQLAAWHCKDSRGFRKVFEAGMQYFPKEMGGLFQRHCSYTAYQMACTRFGDEGVKKILNDGFRRKNHTSTSTCSILKSLLYAATEEIVDLDGVFEILQIEPSVLLQIQAATSCNMKSDENSQKRKSKSDENGRESDDQCGNKRQRNE